MRWKKAVENGSWSYSKACSGGIKRDLKTDYIRYLKLSYWLPKQTMKQRIKQCAICKVDFSTMYRIQYKNPKERVFVCKECLTDVKKDNPLYTYGGTWKR